MAGARGCSRAGSWGLGCPQPVAPQGSRGQATAAGPGPAPAPLGIPARHRMRPPGTATERGAVERRGLALTGAWGPDPLGWGPPGPAGQGRGYGVGLPGRPAPVAFSGGLFIYLSYFPLL